MMFHWGDCSKEEVKRLEKRIEDANSSYSTLMNTAQRMSEDNFNLRERNLELEAKLKINENIKIKKKRCRRKHAIKSRR